MYIIKWYEYIVRVHGKTYTYYLAKFNSIVSYLIIFNYLGIIFIYQIEFQ